MLALQSTDRRAKQIYILKGINRWKIKLNRLYLMKNKDSTNGAEKAAINFSIYSPPLLLLNAIVNRKLTCSVKIIPC